MSQFTKRCSKCKGKGQIKGFKFLNTCKSCEGTGIQLYTDVEEEASDALELMGDKIHNDESSFINLEEDDYEI